MSSLLKIKAFVMDCDGVLTDGSVYYGRGGECLRRFSAIDGKGIELLRKRHIRTAIISGEDSAVIRKRAEKLKIDRVWLGIKDKSQILSEILSTFDVSPSEVAYVGDDINDIDIMRLVGYPIAVANAHDEVKEIAFYVTGRNGGGGAVREAVELILNEREKRSINAGRMTIGRDGCFVIAEIGNNHQGDMEFAKKLIDIAVSSGADAVKMQKRDNRTLFTKDGFSMPYEGLHSFGRTYGEHRECLELSMNEWAELRDYSYSKGVPLFGSVWDENSLNDLESIGLELYKIPSADVTNLRLIESVAKTGKPVILSTGMSYLNEIDRAVETFLRFNENLILMHTVSIYPHKYDISNLGMIEVLRKRYHLPIGFSSHLTDVCLAGSAALLGIVAIEQHLTIDRGMRGSDHRASVEGEEFKQLVQYIRMFEKARGSGIKDVHPSELELRKKLGKTLVAIKDIRKGDVIDWENAGCKCSFHGEIVQDVREIIGRKSLKDIVKDEIISESAVL